MTSMVAASPAAVVLSGVANALSQQGREGSKQRLATLVAPIVLVMHTNASVVRTAGVSSRIIVIIRG